MISTDIYSNFELLNSDGSWRTTWTHIVSGRFTNSDYSSLLFYEGTTGYAELYETDGQGHLIAPALCSYARLGGETAPLWTHIVAGVYGASGYTGLLLYDQPAGVGGIFDTDGQGTFTSLYRDPISGKPLLYTDWRNNWSHIVSGYFKYPQEWNNVQSNETYAGLFFYSSADQYAEIWATDGSGLAGTTALATYPDLGNWTHIVAGDFVWSGNDDQLTDVLCYNTNTGAGQLLRSRVDSYPDTGQQLPMDRVNYSSLPAPSGIESFPVGAMYRTAVQSEVVTNVVAGNFGGSGMANVLFHNRNTGVINIGSLANVPPPPAPHLVRDHRTTPPSEYYRIPRSPDGEYTSFETLVYPRPSADLVVLGNFYMNDPDDRCFFVGDDQNNEQLRNWRASPGGFTDLLFYERAAGLGEFYLKEPKVPPPDSLGTIPAAYVVSDHLAELTGYITSRTRHGQTFVATGSVLPNEIINFHISNRVEPYTSSILFYRATDVGGTPLAQINNLTTPPQAINRGGYRNGAQWSTAASFTVPSWSSGLYIARVTAPSAQPGVTAFVDLPFVVRSSSPGSQSKIRVVITDTTYEAYNDWGGRGFYGYQNPEFAGAAVFPQSGARAPYAFTVSFERPYAGRYDLDDSRPGLDSRSAKWTKHELLFFKWLALQGIAVEVCTFRDLEFEAPSSDYYRLLVFVGHPEYWSRAMRNNAENFAKNGGNLAFYAGNVCWWQVRICSDGTKMICYKNKTFDPYGDPSYTTVNWFDDPVNYPETWLTGVSYYPGLGPVDYQNVPVPFQVVDASHWTMAGTGLINGDTFGLLNDDVNLIILGETDRIQANNAMFSPSTFRRIAWSTAYNQTAEMGTIGIFTPNDGSSYVFTAATINWALGLSLLPPIRRGRRWTAVDQITLNTVIGLSGSFHQQLGLAHDVGVSSTGPAYVIANDAKPGGFGIYSWNGIGPPLATFGAVRIAVDPAGEPWVVDDTGAIKRRIWLRRLRGSAPIWTTVAGGGTDVGVGANGDVWLIGTDAVYGGFGIYKWIGSGWTQIDGAATRIAVDQAGNPWVVNGLGDIYQRVGGVDGYWQQVTRPGPGDALDIGVGPDGSVWVCGGGGDGYAISRWVAGHWARVPGAALNISVGPIGPWITNTNHEILNWF